MFPIKTSFGMIRSWNPQDTSALVKYANNRKVWLNMRDLFPFPYTLENARDFLDVVSRQNPVTFFAIATAEEAVGGIGLTLHQDVHRLTAELGYWLGEPYWGKGLMTESVCRLCEYGFKQFRLVRIYAEPYAWNKASCRVLEKAGFSFEGRMRSSVIKDGQITDQLLYAKIEQREQNSKD
jgi:[ribosomal protein S5]-alanine N-acetyltransferase